jgi:type II secretory pathway pseudopilin PulG
MNPSAVHLQRGFTPVELLVGMAISLFLLVGLAQVFLGTRATTRVEENSARMQEAARIAIELASREIRKAGYVSDALQSRETIFPSDPPFMATATLGGTTSTFVMRFQGAGDGFTRTCSGETVPTTALAQQTLTVAAPLGSTATELLCSARITNGAVAGSVTVQSLAPNLEAMSILIGEDTDGDMQPDRYVAPATIANWENATSINIQLRMVSSEDFLTDAPQPYRDFSGALVTPTDRRMRRNFGTVLSLRNLVP